MYLRELKKENGSVFIYGSEQFAAAVKRLAEEFIPEKKCIRACVISPPPQHRPGGKKYLCTVKYGLTEKQISCCADYPLSRSLEEAGIPCNIRCMDGECGYCRCRLLCGSVEQRFADGTEHRRLSDKQHGYIHPCCAYPVSDLEIEL